MNKAYKSIWNSALGAWVAVSELSRCAGKHSGAVVTLAAPILFLSLSGAAYAQVTSTGNVSSSPGPSPWTVPGALLIGNTTAGTLTIQNGASATVSGALYIGVDSGGVGSVLVTGSGSSLTDGDWTRVGSAGGIGTLTVSNGASVTTSSLLIGRETGGKGVVNVDGPNSLLVNNGRYFTIGGSGEGVPNTGVGIVSITNGGKVLSTDLNMAGNAGSQGTLNIDGAGSSFSKGADLDGYINANIGTFGAATITVSNGGSLNMGEAYLGGAWWYGTTLTAGSANVTVTGIGSSMNNSGSLVVGNNGDAVLTIANGGKVTSVSRDPGFNVPGSQVGAVAGSNGVVTITGVGSSWTDTGSLAVAIGGSGNGMLTVANGGMLNASVGGVAVGANAGSIGTINIGAAAASLAAAPGTVSTPSVTFDAGTGTLNFNHTSTDSSYAFVPVISSGTGSATINQLAGNTNLTANSSNFGGTTNVTGGILRVNGTLGNAASTLNISTTGTLGGRGTIGGNVSVLNGGTIAPGNSIGTLTINGNYVQASGSTYQVQVDSSTLGTSDRINVAGTATIASGSTLAVTRTSSSPYMLNSKYTVLTAAGGVTGTYKLTGDTTSTAFVQLVDTYDVNNVYLSTAQVRSFAAAGLTPNQIATAGGLQTLGSGSILRNALAFLPNDTAARAAFDQLSGEQHASVQTALLEDSRFVREAANDRLLGAFCTPGAATLATASNTTPSKEAAAACAPATDNVAWGRVFGSTGYFSGDGNAQQLNRDTSGFFVGTDTTIASGWRVGGMGGYSHSTMDASSGSSSSDNYHLGVYGGKHWDATSLRLGASYTWHRLDTQRSATFSGFADSLSSKYHAGTTQVFGELGHRMEVGHGIAAEPFAGLAYVNVKTDGFTEQGGLAALTGSAAHADVTFSTLGVRFSSPLAENARLRGMVGWRHSFGEVVPASNQALNRGQPFTVWGVPMAKDVAAVELGVETDVRSNLNVSVSYAGQYANNLHDNGIKLAMTYKF